MFRSNKRHVRPCKLRKQFTIAALKLTMSLDGQDLEVKENRYTRIVRKIRVLFYYPYHNIC